MLVEILVLGGEERVDHQLRHRLDRDIEPPLAGIFGDQRAIGGVHARHHRRLVILQLRVVRQVLGKMPQQTGGRRHPHHEQDGAGREQEAEEAQQELHDRMIPRRARYFITSPPVHARQEAIGPVFAGFYVETEAASHI